MKLHIDNLHIKGYISGIIVEDKVAWVDQIVLHRKIRTDKTRRSSNCLQNNL